jgi:hypothetical protein
VRALTLENSFDALKTLLQDLMAGNTPQKANVQPFSMVIQYFASNVSYSSHMFTYQKMNTNITLNICVEN